MFDGLVCIVGCDKTMPGAAMAIARVDIPSVAFYNGSIQPGTFRGKDVTVQDVFEAIGAYNAKKISAEDLHEMESVAVPGAGACGGQFTANTMSMALEFLGISPAGLNGVPALNRGKAAAAEEAGRAVMRLVRENIRPSQIMTRKALENAAMSVSAAGGSTNGALHLIALARELGVPFDLKDFDDICARTPVIADMKPGGRFVATDMFDAGGAALVARELKRGGLLHADEMTVDGRTIGEIADAVVETPGQPVVLPIDDAAEAARRARRAVGQHRAGGLRAEAVRPRPQPPSRPGARVRLRGGHVRGGQGGRDQQGRRRS